MIVQCRVRTAAAYTPAAMTQLSHIDAQGTAHMVDVSAKDNTERVARARAVVVMSPAVLGLICDGQMPKGDVLGVARIAGIQAAKRTAELIPLCHPLLLTKIDVTFETDMSKGRLEIRTLCRLRGQTGVEMEALTAASIAALTVYDMCKAAERGMRIESIELIEKSGGKSGVWRREDAAP